MSEILPLYNQRGEKIDQISIELSEEVNPALLHQVVVAYQCNQRRGTAATKKRGEVRGGGVKPWRQKGTGRARAGSVRSPIWVGGGVVFGPHPRDYQQRVPKKLRHKAMVMALKTKIKLGALIVLDNLEVQQPKTRLVREILKAIGATEGRILSLVKSIDKNLSRASKNIKDFCLKKVKDCNVLDLMLADKIIMTKDALEHIGGSNSK